MQLAFMEDLKAAAHTAPKRATPGEGLNPVDRGNPWAVFDHFDRVALDCVNQLTPKWSTKLAAFDVYIWEIDVFRFFAAIDGATRRFT
jgi:hypothetical protein